MNTSSVSKTLRSFIRKPFVQTPFAEPVDLRGKKAIVTGASPGSLGFETARTLALWGASIIISTRSNPQSTVQALLAELRDCQPQAEQASISGHSLDLSQSRSVNDFVTWYQREHGEQLDILVNNAGIHLDLLSQWEQPQLSDDGFEIQWRTNYLGTLQLTQLLLPLLEKTGQHSGDTRIVNVVSELHTRASNEELFGENTQPYNSWSAYSLSKLALVHATFEIQRQYAHTGHLQAYCLHPGSVFTNVAAKGLAGNPLIETVRNALAPLERIFLSTAEEGAQTQIHCATAPRLQGGLYYKKCQAAPANPEALDGEIATRLWTQTQTWLTEQAVASANQ